MNLAIIAPSGAGKDLVAVRFSAVSRARFWGSTSMVILPHAARRLRQSIDEAWATRHAHREIWRGIGDELRRDDPAALARHVLARGTLCVGIRARSEFEAARAAGLFALTLWVERPGDPDPTLELDRDDADLIVDNTGTVAALDLKLRRLANALGILRPC